jgi:hypothetical protein
LSRHLKIFISSPSDVSSERRRAALIIEKLSKDYARFFTITPVLWESEPMLASGHFQDAIVPPSQSDIVVLIVWSRLGTPLPARTENREYHGIDGRVPVTGTEWEFENALQSNKQKGAPDLLTYRKTAPAKAEYSSSAEAEELGRQLQKLEGFWSRYFADRGEFRAAFSTFVDLDEFEQRLESDLRRLIERRAAGLRESAPTSTSPMWLKGSPFRGLQTYQFEHAPIFFGRAEATKTAVARLLANAEAGRPFLLVLGASGAGKSSLAQAGILPALYVRGVVAGVGAWLRAVMRPGAHPSGLFASLAAALTAEHALPELLAGQTVANLANHLEVAAEDPSFLIVSALTARENAARQRGELLKHEKARLVLLVDQLEELFTMDGVTQDLRNRFVLCLQALMRSGRVFVIATMRSDYWHRATEIPEFVALSDESGRFDLLPATQPEINEMIRRSAEAAGLTFETDPRSEIRLDASLAAEAASEPGTLPLLSFLLDSMYTADIKQAERSTLTYASMRTLGGLKGAIASRAEAALLALPLNVQNEFPKVLRALVRGPTRRRAPMACFPEGSPDRTIIEALLSPDARLLIAEGDGEGAQVYLAHEALITHWERAKKQIEYDADDFRTLEKVEESEAEYRAAPPRHKRSYLLRDLKLTNAVDLVGRWSDMLSPEQKAFVDKSAKAATAAKWRRWALAAGIAAMVAAIPPVLMRQKIEKEALEKDRYDVAAARGNELLYEDPNLALLLALAFLPSQEGYAYSIEALAYKVLQTPRPKAVLSAPAGLPTATFSPDGQLLLISKGNAFQVWKVNKLELVVQELRPQGVSAGRRAVWSADGRWIIGATDDNRTALFAPCSVPVPALRKYFQQCVNNDEDEVWTIGEKGTTSWPSTLSPTGDRLLTGGSGRDPQLWDIGSKPAKSTFRFQDGRANFAIAFNQQGDRVALGSTDGSIRIHETANPTKGFTLRPRTRCDASGENPSAEVFSVAFNPGKDKGDEMVSTTLDGCLRLWNVKEQRLIENHSLNNTGFFSQASIPAAKGLP